jgi:hypothetical protein
MFFYEVKNKTLNLNLKFKKIFVMHMLQLTQSQLGHFCSDKI